MAENLAQRKPIVIVVGGQYGSESKGLVTAQLVREKQADYCVRTGSINAGHTVYYKGRRYVNQLIPVGWVRKETKLIIGAGAYIHPDILQKEILMINEATGEDVTERLYIDKRCGLHTPAHQAREEEAGLHQRMGSTGKGVMEAIVSKMRRLSREQLFAYSSYRKDFDGLKIVDTVKMLHDAYRANKQIVIEGTQGALLDFHLSHYPYCTSRQTNAVAWAAEAGLPLGYLYEVVMVVRTFPIRVAGNSGYMGREIRWTKLFRRLNEKRRQYGLPDLITEHTLDMIEKAEQEVMEMAGIDIHPTEMTPEQQKTYASILSEFYTKVYERLSRKVQEEMRACFEFTTVTKKLRRIAQLDKKELDYAVRLNRPNALVVNFLNYVYPTCWGATTWEEVEECPEIDQIRTYLRKMSEYFRVPITHINCSPDSIIQLPHPYGVQFVRD